MDFTPCAAKSPRQIIWSRHAQTLLGEYKQESLQVLQLRFTEGDDDLEKMESEFSPMELTDVPLFDDIFSLQKLAALQAADRVFDVLALTGIEGDTEPSNVLETAFMLLKHRGQCWVSISSDATAEAVSPDTLKIYSLVRACALETVESCNIESGGWVLVMKRTGPSKEDGNVHVEQVDGILIDEDPDAAHIPEDTDMANYYDYKEVYPGLEFLKENYDTLLQEVQGVKHWVPWPEEHYSAGSEWKVLPFVYTFPANDPSKTKWISRCCDLCPKTTELLKKVPNIRTALLSRLGPHTSLHLHRGWSDLANHVLRCHMGLQIPAGESGCGLWVNGEIQNHANGKIIVFDDSKIHKAFNNTSKDRIVLIFDCKRPDHIESGRAKGGHTAELDHFIQKFEKWGDL